MWVIICSCHLLGVKPALVFQNNIPSGGGEGVRKRVNWDFTLSVQMSRTWSGTSRPLLAAITLPSSTVVFLLPQTSTWQASPNLTDRRQWSVLRETCTGVHALVMLTTTTQCQCFQVQTGLENKVRKYHIMLRISSFCRSWLFYLVSALSTVHLLIWTTTFKEITMIGNCLIYIFKHNCSCF